MVTLYISIYMYMYFASPYIDKLEVPLSNFLKRCTVEPDDDLFHILRHRLAYKPTDTSSH